MSPLHTSRTLPLGVAAALVLTGCPGGEGADDDTTPTDGSLTDPLSMPAEPTLSPASFNPASDCETCHPDHYAEWSTSMHAYSVVDPVFQVLVSVRQADFDGLQDRFCTQCHTAIGVRGGEVVPGFSFDDLSPIVTEGITCESCHKVSGLARDYNSGHEIDEDGPQRGPITDPIENAYHESAASPLHADSAFCGGCHDVIEASGLDLERPYREWLQSPAAREGKGCGACHMPTRTGPAATDGPDRTLHDHRFIGVDEALTDDFVTDPEVLEEHRSRVDALLETAASMWLDAPARIPAGDRIDLLVTIQNDIDAHNLPTGSTFLRQLWLEVTATDADGNVLYRTGDLDANGDLRDHWSSLDPHGDENLVTLGSGFVDGNGDPTLFPWLATDHTSNTLSPLYARTVTLFVPTAVTTRGPIQVDARLRLRTHPPFLMRALGLDALIEKVRTFELAADTLAVDVEGPAE